MAGAERWYARWDDINVDSDGETVQTAPDLDSATKEVLKHFPKDVQVAISQQPNRRKREALLALNCYVCELHAPPRETPSAQQQLLAAVCEALRGLGEGGEVETLLFKIQEVLSHARVHPQQVEHAVGAAALLQPKLRDPRVVEVVLRAGLHRITEFPARCLARACWSAATLGESEAAAALLYAAMPLAERRAPDFEASDVDLFAWAVTMARPPGARRALQAVLDGARLPAPDTADARMVAWALECWGFNAAPYFGLPPMTVPSELAEGLHRRLRALSRRDDVEVLHDGEPLILWVNDLVAPEEARALLDVAEGRWKRSAVGLGEQSDWRTSDTTLLETAAGPPVPVVERVRRRAAGLLGLPESHCEPPQVTRYLHGQRYEEHVDYFSSDRSNRGLLYLGGQRVATVLVYLASVPEHAGGETLFPHLGSVAPATLGRALVWLNIRPDGQVEEKTLHAGAPITDERCAKYCLNLWLHAYPVQEAAGARQGAAAGAGTGADGGEASPATAAPPSSTQRRPLPASVEDAVDDLPVVPLPPRPRAAPEAPAPEVDAPSPAPAECNWEEMGDELQRLTADLDGLSDPEVRRTTVGRLRAGRLLSERTAVAALAATAAGIRSAQRPGGFTGFWGGEASSRPSSAKITQVSSPHTDPFEAAAAAARMAFEAID